MMVKKKLLNIILKIKYRNKHRNLSEEEKETKRKYGRNTYKIRKKKPEKILIFCTVHK